MSSYRTGGFGSCGSAPDQLISYAGGALEVMGFIAGGHGPSCNRGSAAILRAARFMPSIFSNVGWIRFSGGEYPLPRMN